MTTFGIASKPDRKDEFNRWVAAAEQAGFGLVHFGDGDFDPLPGQGQGCSLA